VAVALATVGIATGIVLVPDGSSLPRRSATGPYEPVAAVGAFLLRSGAAGLAAQGDVRPVVADGAAGVVSVAGIVVTDRHGRARVVARPDHGAPPAIGVAGDRMARWISADAVAVTGLHAGDPLDVEVRGVTEAGPVGSDGSLWLRADADPAGTVRRLDLREYDGEQRLAATFLPVVTVEQPQPPVDVRAVLPVRGGGLRAVDGAGRLELLTGTPVGIAATPLAGARCGAAGTAGLAHAVSDGSGVWFVVTGPQGGRLARLTPSDAGTLRTVAALLPGAVTALAAPGDGSLLFTTRDAAGSTLWRLPDAAAALDWPAGPPLACPSRP
jgi:hypothetical protein